MLDAELRQRPSYLRQLRLRHLLAGNRSVEVMAAAIRVERAEQPMTLNHLAQAAKRRRRTLLLDQEQRADRARRIIQRYDQIERRLSLEPGMARAVLMQQQTHQRPPWSLLPVRRPARCRCTFVTV